MTATALSFGILASLVLLGAGLQFRQHQAAHATAANASAVAASSRPAVAAPPPTQPAKSPAAKAPDLELAQATLKGTAGLLPLSERYPEDPNVLRPLFFAFASRATGLSDAMTVAAKLLRVSPEDALETDLRYLVRKAATTPGQASRLAFDIMTNEMGSVGPDLLYDLMVSEPKVAKTAEQLLATPKVTAKFSPALAIAYDLRNAKTCAARLPLLERAAGLGDKRSVSILFPLSAGSKRGCGHWKRSPCPAACAEEARAYVQAVTKILERQSTAR